MASVNSVNCYEQKWKLAQFNLAHPVEWVSHIRKQASLFPKMYDSNITTIKLKIKIKI